MTSTAALSHAPKMLRTVMERHEAMRRGTPEATALAELERLASRSRWVSEPVCRWELRVLPGGTAAVYDYVADVWVR